MQALARMGEMQHSHSWGRGSLLEGLRKQCSTPSPRYLETQEWQRTWVSSVEKLYIGEHDLSEVHRVSGFARFDFGISALFFYNVTTKQKNLKPQMY